jgi:hypothetical protein
MFVSLTNASPAHRDKKVILNSANIVSIHRATVTRAEDDSGITTIEDITFVHCPPHGTWEVSETLEEIALLLA